MAISRTCAIQLYFDEPIATGTEHIRYSDSDQDEARTLLLNMVLLLLLTGGPVSCFTRRLIGTRIVER